MFLRSVFAACALLISSHAAAAELEAYSRLPAVSDFDISDDGQSVAYVATREGQQTVVVQSLAGDVLQMAAFGTNKIRSVRWAGTDYVLVSTSDTDQVFGVTGVGELFQAVALNVRTGQATQLIRRVRGEQSYANVILSEPVAGTWEGRPVAFVEGIAGNPNSISRRIDLLRVNLDDGTARLHQMGGAHTDGFVVLPDGRVIAQSDYDHASARWTLLLRREGGAWRTVMDVDAPVDRPRLAGFSSDGNSILVRRWDDAEDAWRYIPVAIQTGEVQAALAIPDRSGVILDSNRRVVGHAITRHFTTYTFDNPTQNQMWREITSAFDNAQVLLTSFTPDFRRQIVFVEGTGFSGSYFLFDSEARSLTQIGRAHPDVSEQDIAEVRSITYSAGDGLEIQAYLTLPRGREPSRLPLIVLPHGGPQARDYAGFDWIAQSLASRGYAVLQPNFRGSSGFGMDFVEAAYGEWGRKMQTDLSDGVAYLASRGMIDPERVCIMGASYGGYAALAGVTLQNGVYRCAVSIAGVSDVQTMLADDVQRSGRNNSSYRYWTRYLGVDSHTDARLREVSPVRAAANGNAPVLLIHGRDDTVVDYSQSTAMRQALQAAGRPVEFVELREEDHWLSREPTRIQTIEAAVAFIERHNPPN